MNKEKILRVSIISLAVIVTASLIISGIFFWGMYLKNKIFIAGYQTAINEIVQVVKSSGSVSMTVGGENYTLTFKNYEIPAK